MITEFASELADVFAHHDVDNVQRLLATAARVMQYQQQR